jgi:hypothetical protein
MKDLSLGLNYSLKQCLGSGSARIRIIWPDPEFQMRIRILGYKNWHLINICSEEKYCE